MRTLTGSAARFGVGCQRDIARISRLVWLLRNRSQPKLPYENVVGAETIVAAEPPSEGGAWMLEPREDPPGVPI
jgi:hypothetical protein